MAKRLVNNTQELVNFAQDYRIETEGKSIQDVAQELCDKLMSYYDEYYMYIDNGRQMREAELRNREIEEEVAAIKKLIDSLNTKEESTMKTTNNTATNNQNETIIKEETTMSTANTLATRILNMNNRVERLMYVRDSLINATKTTDELYIKKEELVQFLFDNDIISRMPGKNEFKKTKRQEFVDILMTAVQNLIDAKVITPINAVPVGDLDITHDNAPANDVTTEVPKNNQNEAIRSIIATCCNVQWNNKKQVAKNYISDFMLESCINMALHHKWSKVLMVKTDGTKEYVDSTFTESQKAATQEMKKHLLAGPYFIPHSGGKGYIISAEYMAWFYETQLHKHLIYRFTFKDTSKGHVDYKIDRANKVIINLRDNKSTPFDANTWKTVNTTLNFNKVVD